MFLSVFVGKRKMFSGFFVGKWEMFTAVHGFALINQDW